ncbi:MAG: hypothetical protein P4L85_15655 [Paludisphaera borealis]|uniref:hypothetical protein n=1 Tax=Paludisphaera borealis TaxID=1387353 RepID=UPI00283EDE67|nr:hypothetical protein [Paludisphaera borealis]MDR3620787.1 hypothetical protein [Paludisphaera borealis]
MKHDPVFPKTVLFGCLAVLLLICFHRVLLNDHQFAYRDSAHYYYPLYQRVQLEWNEGRWPLWEPEENSGMPLLGNPTAAVLYPGKVIYAVLPYAWGARIYILAHVALAFAAMVALMRSWRASWTAAGLSALAYTFSGPILFQYCNIIYLVGAAWLPLGVLAADRWIRLGSRRALLGLAFVLAMQTLGGDPQASYLLGLCACGYAVGVAWTGGRGLIEDESADAVAEPASGRKWGRWWIYPLIAAGLIVWIVVTLELARIFPGFRPPRPPEKPTPPLPWMRWAPLAASIAWGLVLIFFLARRRKANRDAALERLGFGLAASAALALALTAAQLLPVVEFTQRTSRAAEEGPHDIYPFSVEPHRLVEMLWPNVFGTYFSRNACWADLIQLSTVRGKIWAPTLYMGCFIVVLALRAFSIRRGASWRVWLSIVVVVTLLGSFGQYTSPIWAARLVERSTGVGWPGIGALDPPDVNPLRMDRLLRDGDGGIYWTLSNLLPGFRQFRFPSKLMTFSMLGLAALAGFGWDDFCRGRGRRRGTIALAACLLTLTVGVLAAWQFERPAILRSFEKATLTSSFGPFDPIAAYGETTQSLVQAALVLAIGVAVLATAGRRPRLASCAALALVSADLAVANHRLIATVPQSLFEAEPEVIKIIKEAERKNPSDGPFRIHRMPVWDPPIWNREASSDRVRDFMQWEHATIQPKYGINLGVEYTHTMGVAELYDYEWYFGPFPRKASVDFAKYINVEPGHSIAYYPRRSFDMWNTRYFVLPSHPGNWTHEYRGYASFLPESEAIYPPRMVERTPEAEKRARDWVENHDYQILRNKKMFPRAWVVHRARSLPAMEGTARVGRAGPMQEILYGGDPIWNDPTMNIFDPLELAWIENDDREALDGFTRGFPPRSSEKVEVEYPHGARVEMTATLDKPGVVVLADVYYPGWKLTIDGAPAPIYRVNRMMRGAAVKAGVSKLVYTYEPASFRLGGFITLAGLGVSALLAAFVAWRPRTPLPWSPVDPDPEAPTPAVAG